jgi:hypothetical protein
MSRVRRAAVATMLAAALTLAGGVVLGSPAQSAQAKPGKPRTPAASPKGDPAVTRRLALQAGLQVTSKHRSRPTVTVGGRSYAAPNPYLAEVPAGTRVDWSYWHRRMSNQGDRRFAAEKRGVHASVAVPTPYSYDEAEPAGQLGKNDRPLDAERLTKLGVSNQFQAVNVHGQLSQPKVTANRWHTHEDQGSIPLAQGTGIGFDRKAVKVTSRIGDGPHGRARDRHGDFDFYRMRAKAGDSIQANTDGSNFDTVLVVYDSAGHMVAANDDKDDESITSSVTYRVKKGGYYYVMVSGFSFRGSLPQSPFRSGSGSGAGEQGTYHLTMSGSPVDQDEYAVQLASGDVLGGVLTGRAKTLSVLRQGGQTAVGSQQDASAAYPPQSPLPGGGATFAYVAEAPGWYTVSAADGDGAYKLLLETYQPGALRAASGQTQTVFLDFDGERLNTGMFGGFGVSTLSPLKSFLPKWGLGADKENALINTVVASVKENIEQTLVAHGLNHHLHVNVLNSRDDADPFGQPNVSRVIVGGTIHQSGVPTIGISQSIDPGNYSHEETAMVLLDEVSLPKGADDSFNTYLRPQSNRVSFIGRGLGNLAAHEIGHMIGSFHTDSLDKQVNLMDSGGSHFDKFFGVGPDHIGGTADDTDVDFGKDQLEPEEGFLGVENTLNNSSWAFLLGTS